MGIDQMKVCSSGAPPPAFPRIESLVALAYPQHSQASESIISLAHISTPTHRTFRSTGTPPVTPTHHITAQGGLGFIQPSVVDVKKLQQRGIICSLLYLQDYKSYRFPNAHILVHEGVIKPTKRTEYRRVFFRFLNAVGGCFTKVGAGQNRTPKLFITLLIQSYI